MDAQSPRVATLSRTNGFRVAQAIHVAATLGIADLVTNGTQTVEELAKTPGTDAPTLSRLLRALASVGVFTETEAGIGQTPLSETLRSDAPGSARAWAMHIGQTYFWSSWGHLLNSIRSGNSAFDELYGMTAWEDASSISILRQCRAAINDGGRLLLVEQVLKGANESDSAKFADLMMLVMLGGRERNAGEFQRLCLEAGFRLTNIIPTDSRYSIVESVAV